ncbi:MAG TPA: acyl-CoA thioesterase [Rhodospirillaceae bacterium]|nr:acyl-CoA thioesterase [Rhodospirillaceae bacterium]
MTRKPSAPRRGDFPYVVAIQTRWSDNDMFGHLNNVIYNRFFESVIVTFYRECTPLDFFSAPVLPYVVEIVSRFKKPLTFPETVDAALLVEDIGTRSVRFQLALFRQGEDEASAYCDWVHVFVDRQSERSTDIPPPLRPIFESFRKVSG